MRGAIVFKAHARQDEAPAARTEGFAFDRLYFSPRLLSFGYEYAISDEAGESLLIVRKRPFSFVLSIDVCASGLDGQRLLSIRQDSLWQFMISTYTVYDAAGQPVAQVRREPDPSLGSWGGNQRWYAHYLMTDARMDTVAEAHPGGDLLNRNWTITRPGDGLLGTWVRRVSLTDKHVLDLSADITRTFDRRLAVALGVLLEFACRR